MDILQSSTTSWTHDPTCHCRYLLPLAVSRMSLAFGIASAVQATQSRRTLQQMAVAAFMDQEMHPFLLLQASVAQLLPERCQNATALHRAFQMHVSM